MTHPKASANSQALRLTPADVDPAPLAHAIWLVSVALGRSPTDEEVREHRARCLDEGETLTGRHPTEPPVRPREWYEVPGGEVVQLRHVTRAEAGGRAQWRATTMGDRRATLSDRSLSRLVRAVEATWPGGTWRAELEPADRPRILAHWGLA